MELFFFNLSALRVERFCCQRIAFLFDIIFEIGIGQGVLFASKAPIFNIVFRAKLLAKIVIDGLVMIDAQLVNLFTFEISKVIEEIFTHDLTCESRFNLLIDVYICNSHASIECEANVLVHFLIENKKQLK